jgi:hypothetical protein
MDTSTSTSIVITLPEDAEPEVTVDACLFGAHDLSIAIGDLYLILPRTAFEALYRAMGPWVESLPDPSPADSLPDASRP